MKKIYVLKKSQVFCSNGCGRPANPKFGTCCAACISGSHTFKCDQVNLCTKLCGRQSNINFKTCCKLCDGKGTHTKMCDSKNTTEYISKVVDYCAGPYMDKGVAKTPSNSLVMDSEKSSELYSLLTDIRYNVSKVFPNADCSRELHTNVSLTVNGRKILDVVRKNMKPECVSSFDPSLLRYWNIDASGRLTSSYLGIHLDGAMSGLHITICYFGKSPTYDFRPIINKCLKHHGFDNLH